MQAKKVEERQLSNSGAFTFKGNIGTVRTGLSDVMFIPGYQHDVKGLMG